MEYMSQVVSRMGSCTTQLLDPDMDGIYAVDIEANAGILYTINF